MFSHSFRKRRTILGGFTLVEMIVTLAIFAIISAVVIARYRDFSGGIILTNLAYDVAITVRQSQVYGLSVKDVGSASFNRRYGVHVQYPTNNSFILFADSDNNSQYTGSGEIVESLGTLNGNTIDDFCGIRSSDGVSECGKAGGITWLDVTFLRPNPDACFKSSNASTNNNCYYYQAVTITVKSPGTGKTRTITVRATGQISVN